MKKVSTLLSLSIFGLLLDGCSHFNESAWQSLKSADALAHPTFEQKHASEKSMSYDDYTRERKAMIEQKSR